MVQGGQKGMKMKLYEIWLDKDIYPRESGPSAAVVKDYIKDLKSGAEFPPIEVQKVLDYYTEEELSSATKDILIEILTENKIDAPSALKDELISLILIKQQNRKLIKTIVIDGGHRLQMYNGYNTELNKCMKKAREEGKDIEESIRDFYYKETFTEVEVVFYKDQILDKTEHFEELVSTAAIRNMKHGEKLAENDLENVCLKILQTRPEDNIRGIKQELAGMFDVTISRISQMLRLSNEYNKRIASRDQKIYKLHCEGWTNEEIGEIMKATDQTIADISRNFSTKVSRVIEIGEQEGRSIKDIADKEGIEEILLWHSKFKEEIDSQNNVTKPKTNDVDRFKEFGDTEFGNEQPKMSDHWGFGKRDPRFGEEYEGMLWGQDVMNVLYQFTKQGDWIVDPMAGGGTVNDVCIVMGRKIRAFDINPHEKRYDIVEWDIREGFPERAKIPERFKETSLILFDPPYYKKKEKEYKSEEITQDRPTFINFVKKFAEDSYNTLKPRGVVAMIYGHYLDYEDELGSIYGFHLVDLFEEAGFKCVMKIQSPLILNNQYNQFDMGEAKTHDPWKILPISRDWYVFRKAKNDRS
jgi:hypothetical protein